MATRRASKIWIAAAFCAAGTVPAYASVSDRLVIPFEINRFDHMVVEMQINGAAMTSGVVDTAATFAMVDSAVAARSGVQPPGEGARRVNILGVNGEGDYPVVHLETVLTGNARIKAMDAAYVEGIDVPGVASNVLPASAFPGDVLEFDFDSGTISAYDGKPDVHDRRYADSVPYTVEGGLIFVDIRVNGRKGRGLIDTGASLSYVNSAFAKRASMRRNDDLTRQLLGATGDTQDAWIVSVRQIRLADFVVERPDLLVSDPVLLEKLGLSEEPIMVLGLDFLSRFRLQFDRPNENLILSLPQKAVVGVDLKLNVDATRLKR